MRSILRNDNRATGLQDWGQLPEHVVLLRRFSRFPEITWLLLRTRREVRDTEKLQVGEQRWVEVVTTAKGPRATERMAGWPAPQLPCGFLYLPLGTPGVVRAVLVARNHYCCPRKSLNAMGPSRAGLSNMAATSHMWLFKVIKIRYNEVQFLGHPSHISSAQEPPVANGYCTSLCKYRTFPSAQKVLLDLH